jgi:acyl-CoA thioesterase-1
VRRTDVCTFGITVTPPPRITLTNFVAFGDSMTAGEVVSEGRLLRTLRLDFAKSYPTALRTDLKTFYTAQVDSIVVSNQGFQGETTSAGLSRLPYLLSTLTPPPQVLLLMEGANDLGGRDLASAISNIRSMVQFARSRGLQVFLASIPPENPFNTCFPNRGGNWAFVAPFNSGVQSVAASEGATFVDVFQAFGGGTGTPGLIDCDGLHPTPQGYQLIADTFAAAIKQSLSVPTTTSNPIQRRPLALRPRQP